MNSKQNFNAYMRVNVPLQQILATQSFWPRCRASWAAGPARDAIVPEGMAEPERGCRQNVVAMRAKREGRWPGARAGCSAVWKEMEQGQENK